MTRNESVEYTSTFNSRNKKEGEWSLQCLQVLNLFFNITIYNMFSLSSTYFKQYLLIYYILKIIQSRYCFYYENIEDPLDTKTILNL
jgi:hypothetical protein